MSAVKHTMLFQLTTPKRVAGWSESWYALDFFPSAFNLLCELRAGLLPNSGRIVGQRYQVVDPTGTSSTGSTVFVGGPGDPNDIPQMALFCRVRSAGLPNIKGMTLRGIPDGQVTLGEYTPSGGFVAAFNLFVDRLRSAQWRFRGRDFGVSTAPIFSISTAGVVNTTEDFSTTINEIVRISQVRTSSEFNQNGEYRVSAVTGARQFTIADWSPFEGNGGKVYRSAITYPICGAVDVARIVSRKVGRPFDQYRGRASNRR